MTHSEELTANLARIQPGTVAERWARLYLKRYRLAQQALALEDLHPHAKREMKRGNLYLLCLQISNLVDQEFDEGDPPPGWEEQLIGEPYPPVPPQDDAEV